MGDGENIPRGGNVSELAGDFLNIHSPEPDLVCLGLDSDLEKLSRTF